MYYRLMLISSETNELQNLETELPWQQWGFQVIRNTGEDIDKVKYQVFDKKPHVILSGTYPSEIRIALPNINHDGSSQVYLLKGIELEDFENLFCNLKQQLDNKKIVPPSYKLMKGTRYGRMLSHIVSGDKDKESFQELERDLGLDFERCFVMIIDIDKDSGQDSIILRQRVKKYCSDRFSNLGNQFFIDQKYYICGIITVKSDEAADKLFDEFQKLRAEIYEIYGLKVWSGMSGLNTDKGALPYAYDQALNKMHQKQFSKLVSTIMTSVEQLKNDSKLNMPATKMEFFENHLFSNGRSVFYKELEVLKNNYELIRQMKKSGKAHYQLKDFSVDVLAQQLEQNPAYLERIFEKETGKTFSEYLLRERLRKSKELLLEDILLTEKVADLSGFSNESEFYQAFYSSYKILPDHYQAIYGQEQKPV